MYYDTATNLLKWWDGTTWVNATGPAGVVYDTDQVGHRQGLRAAG